MITFTCPNCYRRIEASEEFCGMTVSCKQCGILFEVPGQFDAIHRKRSQLNRHLVATGVLIGVGLLFCLTLGIACSDDRKSRYRESDQNSHAEFNHNDDAEFDQNNLDNACRWIYKQEELIAKHATNPRREEDAIRKVEEQIKDKTIHWNMLIWTIGNSSDAIERHHGSVGLVGRYGPIKQSPSLTTALSFRNADRGIDSRKFTFFPDFAFQLDIGDGITLEQTKRLDPGDKINVTGSVASIRGRTHPFWIDAERKTGDGVAVDLTIALRNLRAE